MNIGDTIKARRKELGLTLEQVGDAVGVGKSTVRKWENGMIANMKRDKIVQLAGILQMSPVDLIEYEILDIYLSDEEKDLLEAYRNAEPAFQQEALGLLKRHPKQ